MFVVNTTSATRSRSRSRRSPRKRVPSSRRRNPALVLAGITALFRRSLRRWCRGWCGGRRLGRRRERRQRHRRRRVGGRRRGRRSRALTRERIEHGRWRGRPRSHDLQNERECEEDAGTPPRRAREQIRSLPCADERIRGRGGTAEIRRKPTALSRLKQDGRDENETVDDEQNQQKGVHRAGREWGELSLQVYVSYEI